MQTRTTSLLTVNEPYNCLLRIIWRHAGSHRQHPRASLAMMDPTALPWWAASQSATMPPMLMLHRRQQHSR